MPSAVPQSSSITLEAFPALLNASAVTKKPAPSAPKKAQKFIGEINLKTGSSAAGSVRPARITVAITAPNVAPEEMPIIPGSARGLRKNSWKVAPLEPRRSPVTRTSRQRGSLMRHKIMFSNFVPFPRIAWGFIFSAPKRSESAKAKTKSSRSKTAHKGCLAPVFLELRDTFFIYSKALKDQELHLQCVVQDVNKDYRQ